MLTASRWPRTYDVEMCSKGTFLAHRAIVKGDIPPLPDSWEWDLDALSLGIDGASLIPLRDLEAYVAKHEAEIPPRLLKLLRAWEGFGGHLDW